MVLIKSVREEEEMKLDLCTSSERNNSPSPEILSNTPKLVSISLEDANNKNKVCTNNYVYLPLGLLSIVNIFLKAFVRSVSPNQKRADFASEYTKAQNSMLSLQNVKLEFEKEAKKEELEMKKEELEIRLKEVNGLIEIQNRELEYKEKSMEWQRELQREERAAKNRDQRKAGRRMLFQKLADSGKGIEEIRMMLQLYDETEKDD
jgi:hypothetical protein